MKTHYQEMIFTLSFLVLLTACGGGGTSAGTTSNAPSNSVSTWNEMTWDEGDWE